MTEDYIYLDAKRNVVEKEKAVWIIHRTLDEQDRVVKEMLLSAIDDEDETD